MNDESILLNQIARGIALYKRDTSSNGKVRAKELVRTAVMNLRFITKSSNIAGLVRPFIKMGSVSFHGYTIYNDSFNYRSSKQEFVPAKD